MIPVYSWDRRGGGDCFRAAVASLLELPASSVPHVYCDDSAPEGPQTEQMEAFLRRRGLSLQRMAVTAPSFEELVEYLGFHEKTRPIRHYLIASGSTAVGSAHCVIVCGGRVVHNPSPGIDIVAPFPEGWFQLDLIVPAILAVPMEGAP